MKRIIAIAVLLLGFALAASAQPKSFGLRAGYGLELSYQHNAGPGFIETDFGVLAGEMHGLRLAALYDWVVLNRSWKPCDFKLYVGPGLTAGMYDKGKFGFGLAGQFGCEFSFKKLPVEVTVDTCPGLWFRSDDMHLDYASFIPMVGLRWKF